ncbi:MAG TPA: sugar porter family MFS transporter [Pseudonocardiaceae bacterium]|nr:sugar porter family MFS transporter [Pseudonocardiaceae bacterium]
MTQSSERVPARRATGKGTLYFFGALGGILFGYDLGVISGVLLFIKTKSVFDLGSVGQGVVGGCLAAGAIIGAAIAGRLTDRPGRRRTIMIGATIFAIGTIGCTFSPNATMFVISRFIVGVAVGATSATVPTYLSELAPSRVRGALSSLNQLMIVSGILIAYVVDWAFQGSANWRAMIAIGIIPAAVLLFGMTLLPETPRWLIKQGREDEARTVIHSAQGEVDIDAEVTGIREVIRLDGNQGSLKDLFAKWVRPMLVVALILAVGQQFSGVNAINLYAPTIFKNLGVGTSASLLASIVLGVVKVAFTAWVIFMVDRWGRKPLLLLGNVLMSATLILLGIAVTVIHSPSGAAISTIVLLIIYLAGYELGWGAVVWVMMSEVFPLKVRGVGMGAGSVVLWAATFTITFVFPVMDNSLGLANSAYIFAGIGIVLFLLVAKFVPETKGRSLEQIELDLRDRVKV